MRAAAHSIDVRAAAHFVAVRAAALGVAVGLLGGCGGDPPQLFSAYCEDGTRVVATRERAENLCFRRKGLRQIEPFRPEDENPPPPEG